MAFDYNSSGQPFPILENKIKVLPHSCFICSKAFVRKNTLLKHYREHTKELGENLERLEDERAKYLVKKFPNQPPPDTIRHDKFVNDVYPLEPVAYEPPSDDHNVIQNLDSNDIIVTNMEASNVMVQDLDPESIVVEHLEPQSFDDFPGLAKERHGCTVCGNCYMTAGSLSAHMHMAHERSKDEVSIHKCEVCGAGFVQLNSLKNHYQIHKGQEPHDCKSCSERFFTISDLNTHLIHVHKMKPKKVRYECQFCDADFFKKSALKMHYLSHPNERPYVCDICNESYAEESKLIEHKVIHKEEEVAYLMCESCGKGFARKSDLMRHNAQAHGKKPLASKDVNKKSKSKPPADNSATKKKLYVCSVCSNAFKDRDTFEKHKKTHAKKSITCEICEKTVLKDMYEDHMLMHNEGRAYTCRVCSESFVFKEDLTSHVRTAHEDDCPFKCADCPERFKFKSDLREHRQVHAQKAVVRKGHTCKICHESFAQKAELVRHGKGCRKAFPCKTCGEKYPSRKELKEHEECHMEFEIVVAPFEGDDDSCDACSVGSDALLEHTTACARRNPHHCKNCNRRFQTKAELLDHKKVHSRRQPFICKVCNEGFCDRASLDEHRKTHNTSPTYPCNICDKAFAQREHLKEHKRSHAGEIAYICSVCEATFEDKVAFKAHRETHDIIVHQCKVCSETFSVRKDLKKHYLKHILERPNMCRICNAGFEQWGALRSHYLSHTRS